MATRNQNDWGHIDLSKLDLDGIDLELEDKPSQVLHLLYGLFLLTMGGLVLWFPTTDYYHAMGASNAISFTLAIGGAGIGIAFGRWLWRYLEEFTARYQQRVRKMVQSTGPAPAWVRWGLFFVGVGGAFALAYGLPNSAMGESNNAGFVASIAAVIVGFVLGRWLLLQAEAQTVRRPARPAFRLPSWFKWVTFSVLLAGGLFAAFGLKVFGDGSDESLNFTLGMVAFLVGIFGAIWIAKRFDETERRLKAQTQQRTMAERAARARTP